MDVAQLVHELVVCGDVEIVEMGLPKGLSRLRTDTDSLRA
jgi:hypothetical protein